MELVKRLITAAILIVLFVFIWQQGGQIMDITLMLIALVGMWEFARMFMPENKKGIIFAILLCLIFCLLYLFTNVNGLIALMFIGLILAIFSLIEWSNKKPKAFENAGVIAGGLLYIPIILMLTSGLSPYEQVFVLFVPVASDSLAYFTGLSIGKRKIWPSVSPKKSVEGSIGGLIGAVAFTVIFTWHYGHGMQANNVYMYAIMGVILGIMAQMGDFFESGLKRHTGVKDSSNILPGHGGVLDRLDSILFVIPTYLFITALLPFLRF